MAARAICAGHNNKDENNEFPADGEPAPPKTTSQKHIITDEIFDLIWNLDDQHLMSASRIVKAAIEYRQEMRREETHGPRF